MGSGQNPLFGQSTGGTPLLRRSDADDETQAQLPEFSSVDHFRLAEWVIGALSLSDRRIRDHLADTARNLQEQINNVVAAVKVLDDRGANAATERKQMADKLDDISAQLNQLLGQANADAGQKGWMNSKTLPYVFAMAVMVFAAALIWAVIFGDDSVRKSIDHMRGVQDRVEAPRE